MKNNSSCAWYWHAFGIFFLVPPPRLSNECRPLPAWVSQESALQEATAEVKGFIDPKARMRGALWSGGASALQSLLQTHASGGGWGAGLSSARGAGDAATLVSTRSAPLSMLLSLDCLLLYWGIPTELEPRSLKARDAVCADCSRLGHGFLEGIPGQPALMEKRSFLGARLLLAWYGAALTVFLLRRWRKAVASLEAGEEQRDLSLLLHTCIITQHPAPSQPEQCERVSIILGGPTPPEREASSSFTTTPDVKQSPLHPLGLHSNSIGKRGKLSSSPLH